MPDIETLPMNSVSELGARSKAASRVLASVSTSQKNSALQMAADSVLDSAEGILEGNRKDVDRAREMNIDELTIDRLQLTEKRLQSMAEGLRKVTSLPDPVGEVVDDWTRPNGLKIRRVRVPLGVVVVIYENRPNVTSDTFGLCLKSGNSALLRGSSAAINSNSAIVCALQCALSQAGLPSDSVLLVEDTSHETAIKFMQLNEYIDCLIPRGGRSLIESIRENATVPYVIDGDGNCHIYVDEHADFSQAIEILVNAKTQRPTVCNAAESLVVHASVAQSFLPLAVEALHSVELVGDEISQKIVPVIGAATDDDFSTEYLDLKLSVKVVDSLEDAIGHINETGSGHSEAIITSDLANAEEFSMRVDAAAVLVNASTRFVDGEEFGFGAEIGISTQKLHARGPMGLEQLTTNKYIVNGMGHIRG